MLLVTNAAFLVYKCIIYNVVHLLLQMYYYYYYFLSFVYFKMSFIRDGG